MGYVFLNTNFMMMYNSIILIFFTVFLSKTIGLAEDLLDQYVKHVEKVNRISYNGGESNEFPKPSHEYNHPKGRYLTRNLKVAVEEFEESSISSVDPSKVFSDLDSIRERRDASSDILWTHSEVLDDEGRVVLRWQPRHQEILFRVEARTRGYVGLGFSPDGKMEKSDIILTWVDDRLNQPFLMDCHGVPKSQGSAPVKDEMDNYTLMRGIQNDTHTIIEFRRAYDTCDPDDYVLSSDTVHMIWALHDNDPPHGAEMVYHEESRGSQSIHLLGPPPVMRMPVGHSSQWNVLFENLNVPNEMTTMYWCKIFKAPTLNNKHHIVGFEPLIGRNHSGMVHHMIMHECDLDDSDDVAVWDAFSKEGGRLCYANMPPLWDKCLTPLVAWAVGSKGENFPNHIGLPLADKKNSFYMLEVHFDNPTMRSASDTSGLRLHYTSELRQHEGGILITGVAPSTLHFVPPHQPEYKTAGYCSVDCTKEVIPKDGINVVSVMLHSHSAARKLKLRHIRAMKELSPLAEDNHYDFNYQQSRRLSQDTLILPGDGLITECTYSTLGRDKPTLGGYSTKDEMCLAFVLHYPRTQLSGCYSIPPVKYFFETLGIREFYGKDMVNIEKDLLEGKREPEPLPTTTSKPFIIKPGDENSEEANQRAIIALKNAKEYSIDGESSERHVFDKLVIKEPAEFKNLTFTEHLHNMPYNETVFTKKMEEYFYKGLHLTFCRKRDDSLIIKEDIVKLPEFQEFQHRENIQCSHRTKSTVFAATLDSNSTGSRVYPYQLFHCLLLISIIVLKVMVS
ncbi:MOXD1 homolog 1 isoform X1 [Leptinotarsa decemlineata]|uniref:MOXD1 homolog 1 isoform X1 n=2 Tax=Leptinotarsa decemlineata TaxID=7539 RepID=UPI003D303E5C